MASTLLAILQALRALHVFFMLVGVFLFLTPDMGWWDSLVNRFGEVRLLRIGLGWAFFALR